MKRQMKPEMKRRRFLQICGAAGVSGLLAPQRLAAQPIWQGRAFGADLSLILQGQGDSGGVLATLPQLLSLIEAEFSLYDPHSALSRLNALGRLRASPAFAALFDWADVLHHLTDGAFDPTVQALWQAQLTGQPPGPVSWARVCKTGAEITLPPQMALTFNGIAQGYAADAVRGLLAQHGFHHALIDMGEQVAMGGPWRIGLSDPVAGMIGERHLSDSAIATSSPMATLLRGQPHLIHPQGLPPQWSTVSVEADLAVLADGLSTAAVFMNAEKLRDLAPRISGLRRITTVDFSGNLQTVLA